MIIESERLKFRPYSNDDFEFLFSLLTDPEMMRYIGEGKIKNRKEAQIFLEWIYDTYASSVGMGLMVLVDKEGDNLIGHAGLIPQTIDGVKEVEIGYWISRKQWGKGYATEAANTLKEYGFNVLCKERFIALVQTGNAPSKKVAAKLGMDVEKKILLHGQDVEVYSISK